MKTEKHQHEKSSAFECIICMETAKEPIVVKCGHLFCWPCIYEWIEKKKNSASCPVCKNQINDIKSDCIPIFTKDENSHNTNRFRDIPKRPNGERNADTNAQNNTGEGRFQFMGGFGFFPFFGFNFNFNSGNNSNNNTNNQGFNMNDPLNNLPPQFKQALVHFFILMFMIYFFSSLKYSIYEEL